MSPNPIRQKRVFMLSSQPLFSRGVESLLCDKAGVAIVGWESDVAKAIQCIRGLKPDVVLVDSKDLESSPLQIVAPLLKEEPGIKIIALNLENEAIRVYRGERRAALTIEDLVEAITESDPKSNPPPDTSV